MIFNYYLVFINFTEEDIELLDKYYKKLIKKKGI